MSLIVKELIAVSLLLIVAVAVYLIDMRQRSAFVNESECKMKRQDLAVNNLSPAITKKEIIIDAPVEDVWNKVTSISEWVAWQSAISKVEIRSAPVKNTTFTWSSNGIDFESTIHTNNLYVSFGWIGTTFGVQAIHNWYFIADKSKTKVIVEESLQGLLVCLMPSYFQNKLAEGMDTNLRELKIACEL